MKIKYIVFSCIGLLVSIAAYSQKLVEVAFFDARMDYLQTYAGSKKDADRSGFKGKFSNFSIGGHITPKISYFYRQRFSKPIKDGNFLDATDYLDLTYKASDRWRFCAGKQDVNIGGYEYDYTPINYYHLSEFVYAISCYNFGVKATYCWNNGEINAQITQSTFDTRENDLYSYNLLWRGRYGKFTTIWSTNMVEYAPGAFIHYIALGTKFNYGCGHVFLDYINRYAKGCGAAYLGDFSIVSELHYMPLSCLNILAKYTYDYNKENLYDSYVFPGTKLNSLGGGLEYFPIKDKKDVRLHATYFYSWGKNGNPEGVLKPDGNYLNVGVTWRFDITKIRL